jgi:hypothetical protein
MDKILIFISMFTKNAFKSLVKQSLAEVIVESDDEQWIRTGDHKVWFTFKPNVSVKPFQYSTTKDGKDLGVRTVYCYNSKDALTLINYWNRQPQSGYQYEIKDTAKISESEPPQEQWKDTFGNKMSGEMVVGESDAIDGDESIVGGIDDMDEGFDPQSSAGPNGPDFTGNPYKKWNADMRKLEEDSPTSLAKGGFKKFSDAKQYADEIGGLVFWWVTYSVIPPEDYNESYGYAKYVSKKAEQFFKEKYRKSLADKQIKEDGDGFNSVKGDNPAATMKAQMFPYADQNDKMRQLENNGKSKTNYKDIIDNEWDEGNPNDGGDGYWIQLKDGWEVDGSSAIHEPTRKKALLRLKDAKMCQLEITTPSVKTFREIQNELDPERKHHDLTLTCVKCGTTQTCRCSKPKRKFNGICKKCAEM